LHHNNAPSFVSTDFSINVERLDRKWGAGTHKHRMAQMLQKSFLPERDRRRALVAGCGSSPI
jgi:hypothetical protein